MSMNSTAPAAELLEVHPVDAGKKRLAQLSSHLMHRGLEVTRLPRCSSLIALASLHGAQSNDAQGSAASELAARGFAPVRGGAVRKALHELGEKGYTVLVDMMNQDHLEQLRARFEQLSAMEGRLGGIEVLPPPRQQQLLEDTAAEGPNVGVRRLGDLVNKGECFDRIWQNEVLLSIVMGVLPGPFKLHSLNGHDPKPGHGHQALHADWGGPESVAEVVAAGVWSEDSNQIGRPACLFGVLNSAWCLDDFTAAAGATRVVPGSHLVAGTKPSNDADSRAVQVVANAGSVIVWNGSTWHGGSLNSTASQRRAIHCAWIDRKYPQQTDQRKYLRGETVARFKTSLPRYLLDVE